MLACYVDESGDTGILPNITSPVQPLLCVLGLSLDVAHLRNFTREFMDLKVKFFPNLFSRTNYRLERLLTEIKGAEIRSAFRAREGNYRRRHTHVGFLEHAMDLVEKYDCKIFGRIWVKGIGIPIDSWGPYTSSIQYICSTFQYLLSERHESGFLIVDPRLKVQDRRVSFSVFTQKFRWNGDAYPGVVEMPTFGQGENHAGIQVVDLLCSGLLFPIAAYNYCTGYVNNIMSTLDIER